MKKLLALILMLIIALVVSVPTHSQYIAPNALYNDGEVITLDQNIWGWEDDTLPSNTVVTIIFDDNGTTNYIYDDIILDVVAQ